MNKQKTPFEKITTLCMILFGLAYFLLQFLELQDILATRGASQACFGLFWLCGGLLQWNRSRKMAILDFVLAGGWILLAVLRFFL